MISSHSLTQLNPIPQLSHQRTEEDPQSLTGLAAVAHCACFSPGDWIIWREDGNTVAYMTFYDVKIQPLLKTGMYSINY